MKKLTGRYVFYPLNFYKYLVESSPKKIKEDLGETMLFSIMGRVYGDYEFDYKDDFGNKFRFDKNSGLLRVLGNLYNYWENNTESPSLKENVKVLIEKEDLLLEFRGKKYTISEKVVEMFLTRKEDYKEVPYKDLFLGEEGSSDIVKKEDTILEVEENIEFSKEELLKKEKRN